MLRQKTNQFILASTSRGHAQTQALQAQLLLKAVPVGTQTRLFCAQVIQNQLRTVGQAPLGARSSGLMGSSQIRSFATKKDEKESEDVEPVKKRRGRPPKAATLEASSEEAPAKKPRATRAKKVTAEVAEEGAEEVTLTTKRTRKSSNKATAKPLKMYVLKFNSPILPYAKFPLTHNRYI